MKLFQMAVAATVLLGSAAGARAGTITVGLEEAGVNSGNITTEGSTTAGAIGVGSIAYGTFTVNLIQANGTTAPGMLDSSSLNASSSTAGTIYVFVTEQGITSPVISASWLSTFTANLVPSGWTVTEDTFLSTANGLYATTTPIATSTFTSGPLTNVDTNVLSVGAGPYSVTEEYILTATGAGTANDTIDLSASPVPEPGTLGLLGASLIGLAYFRRRNAAFHI